MHLVQNVRACATCFLFSVQKITCYFFSFYNNEKLSNISICPHAIINYCTSDEITRYSLEPV